MKEHRKGIALLLAAVLAASLASVALADEEEPARSEDAEVTAEAPAEEAAEPLAADAAETISEEEVYTALAANTDSGTCGDNVTWVLEDGILTISGTGAMEDYSRADAPYYSSYAS
ncbi:MAG: hypothetical protein LUG25_04890, partial [Oscillospiraceae bacterium]|nr:hypothetical protein [Oscillospiraceae bacterium]